MSGDVLPMREALEQWCEPSLVEAVRVEERRQSKHNLDGMSRIQLTHKSERYKPTSTSWMAGTDFTGLNAAWHDLERDLRSRIEDGRIHVRGVQAKPERRIEPEIIPRAWAGDFHFDFDKGTIRVDKYRFTAITCSRIPWDPAPSAAAQPIEGGVTNALPEDVAGTNSAALRVAKALIKLRPEDVADLDDETIFVLLEEHARRVIAGPDAKLIAPGKVSLIPMIRGKMRQRAQQNELLETLVSEAEWLARWIGSKVESHHVPTAGTISKTLSKEYALLKPRSTSAI